MAPSQHKNRQTKATPLRRFDYSLVAAPLAGLLFNIDRDLERKVNEAEQNQATEDDRKFTLLHVIARFAINSYKAVAYLTADTPPDSKRLKKFVLLVPTINRQLLDLQFSLIFMLDDFGARSFMYQRAAYRELREEDQQFRTYFKSDPVWKAHFRNTKEGLERLEVRFGITSEESRNPSLIAYWKHPFEFKDEKTKSRDFLRYLNKWLYSDTSAQAHLSFAGLLRAAPFLMSDLIGGETQIRTDERLLGQYRYQFVSRVAFTVLSIATEIDAFCSLGNKTQASYLWTVFSEHVPEAKEVWELRYKSIYLAS